MKDDLQVVELTACLICNAVASDDSAAMVDTCCDECAHLLRWFRGYFAHDPSFGVSWWITPETTVLPWASTHDSTHTRSGARMAMTN